MAKASDNLFPKVLLDTQASNPSAPSGGTWKVYAKANGVFAVGSNGTAVGPFGAGGGGISSGTGQPGGPASGDLFFRTDLGLMTYYNGTRWLTVNQYSLPLANDTVLQPFSANGQPQYSAPWGGVYDLWLEHWYATTSVATTNDGTKYWTCVLENNSGTDIATFNTSADTASTATFHTVTIGALLGTSVKWVQTNITKTSTPGTLVLFSHVSYRLVIT